MIARVVRSMRGYLATRSFVASVPQTRNFYSACNFGIIRLNSEILPENERNLKFHKQITDHFFDKKWLMKFSKFRLIQPKFSFINLNYKQANFLLNLA